jgi:hypothetical protein
VIRQCKINRNTTYAVYVHDHGQGAVEGCDLRSNRLGAWFVGSGCRVRRSSNRE